MPVWHAVKSLEYFVDAEENDLPEMLKPVNWIHVKHFFTGQAKLLAKQWGDRIRNQILRSFILSWGKSLIITSSQTRSGY